MLREIDQKLIAKNALHNSSDMAKLGCNGCDGCSECCSERAEAITLDAYDVGLLKMGLNCSFEKLIELGYIKLSLVDGVILPTLAVKTETETCVFLNAQGRCDVHSFRPGICRMFPLARVYHEDGSFSYFLQEGECPKSNGVKIKISKWLEYPDIRGYELAVREYHDALKELRKECAAATSHEDLVQLQRNFLEAWFV